MNEEQVRKRIKDLEDNIQQDLDILKEYEDALRFEKDPRHIVNYRKEIEKQHRSLASYQQEYDKLKNQLEANEIQKIINLFQQKDEKLTEGLKMLINTMTAKSVLILGRFAPERKAVLIAIQDELRRQGYLPMLFDWEKPTGRTFIETISVLAFMSRFIIADITDAKSIIAELEHIVLALPSVAVQPIMLETDFEYPLLNHIRIFKSVLPVYRYETPEMLLSNLKECVIDPAEKKAQELTEFY